MLRRTAIWPEAVRENEFRSDLYYRLNVFPIRVPRLRERREDIRLLTEHFVQKFAQRMKKSITSSPTRTLDALMKWEWPGNARELENFIERSVILTQGSVLVSPLGEMESTAKKEQVRMKPRKRRSASIFFALCERATGRLAGCEGQPCGWD